MKSQCIKGGYSTAVRFTKTSENAYGRPQYGVAICIIANSIHLRESRIQ